MQGVVPGGSRGPCSGVARWWCWCCRLCWQRTVRRGRGGIGTFVGQVDCCGGGMNDWRWRGDGREIAEGTVEVDGGCVWNGEVSHGAVGSVSC